MRAFLDGAASPGRGLMLSILFPVAAGLLFSVPSLAQAGGGESLCSEEEYNSDGCTLNDETTTISTVPPETVSLHQPGLFGTSNTYNPTDTGSHWGGTGGTMPAAPPVDWDEAGDTAAETVDVLCDLMIDVSLVGVAIEGYAAAVASRSKPFRDTLVSLGKRAGPRAALGGVGFVQGTGALCALTNNFGTGG